MVKPINITSAAIITQFSAGAIMFIGALILYGGKGFVPSYRDSGPDFSKLAWIIIAFILLTLGCLVFSDEFSKLYQPLFGSASFPLLPWSAALVIVYTLNIFCVAVLVASTGGSRISPFTPLYTIFLTLAIFLREPLERIIFYLILTTILFSMTFKSNLFSSKTFEEPTSSKISFWVISIFSLILAAFIGYVTRPF